MTTPTEHQLTPPGGWRLAEAVRIPPLDVHRASPMKRLLVAVVNRLGHLDASNLFLTLMQNTRLFRRWLRFASTLMPYGEIDRVDTERVILRVAWNCRSRYEWGQHVDIGMRAGLTAKDIEQVVCGGDAEGLSTRVAALLRACDEFHQERMISAPTWQALAAHYERRHLLEVVMLMGHYEMLAGVLNSTGISLDPALERVLAEAPIHERIAGAAVRG